MVAGHRASSHRSGCGALGPWLCMGNIWLMRNKEEVRAAHAVTMREVCWEAQIVVVDLPKRAVTLNLTILLGDLNLKVHYRDVG